VIKRYFKEGKFGGAGDSGGKIPMEGISLPLGGKKTREKVTTYSQKAEGNL